MQWCLGQHPITKNITVSAAKNMNIQTKCNKKRLWLVLQFIYVYLYIVVYLYMGGMGQNLVSRAFRIYTLPNLCSHWIKGLCFIVIPSMTPLSHRKPTSARTSHDNCMLRTAAKWMHILCHKYTFEFLASLLLFISLALTICYQINSILKSEIVLHCIYLYVHYIRNCFKYKFYHN